MYVSVGGVLFNKTLSTLIQYPGGLAGSYAIPDSVTSIGDIAFNYCSGLNSVTLPHNLTRIGVQAFANCGLKSVVIPNSVLSIGDNAFLYCGLTNVTIGNGVTNIGNYAFLYCRSLHQAYFLRQRAESRWRGSQHKHHGFLWRLGNGLLCAGHYGLGLEFRRLAHSRLVSIATANPQFRFWFWRAEQSTSIHHSWAINTAVVVETSTNLQNWSSVITNTLVNGTNLFTDPK